MRKKHSVTPGDVALYSVNGQPIPEANMHSDLAPIEERTLELERAMVKLLRVVEAQAAETGEGAIHIPDVERRQLTERLEAIRNDLFGTADTTTLRLVTEQHDTLRIRLIYLEHLLRRDIPRPYVEQALREFTGSKGPAPTPATTPVREVPVIVPESEGLLGFLRQLLFGRRSRRTPARARRGATSSPVAVAPVTAPVPDLPESELRIIYLHKLMEQDAMKLLADTDRPPALPRDVHLPPYLARFSVRDFAETHFAVRITQGKRDIARTPEELRRKLAGRAGPEAPKNSEKARKGV